MPHLFRCNIIGAHAPTLCGAGGSSRKRRPVGAAGTVGPEPVDVCALDGPRRGCHTCSGVTSLAPTPRRSAAPVDPCANASRLARRARSDPSRWMCALVMVPDENATPVQVWHHWRPRPDALGRRWILAETPPRWRGGHGRRRVGGRVRTGWSPTTMPHLFRCDIRDVRSPRHPEPPAGKRGRVTAHRAAQSRASPRAPPTVHQAPCPHLESPA